MPEHDIWHPDQRASQPEAAGETAFTEADFAVEQASTDDDPLSPVSQVDTPSERTLEELSLAELLSLLWAQPRQTWAALTSILQPDSYQRPRIVPTVPNTDNSSSQITPLGERLSRWWATQSTLQLAQIGGYLLALMWVLIGNSILHSTPNARRSEEAELVAGAPFLFLGFGTWLAAEFVGRWNDLQVWWHERGVASTKNVTSNENVSTVGAWYQQIPLSRWMLAGAGAMISVVVWVGTTGNTFTTLTFYLWLIGIACWAFALAPLDFNLADWASGWIDRLRRVQWKRHRRTIAALLLMMTVATAFRVADLADHPREMTDDHVEKILDAGLVRDGLRPIFFANNGGREPFQMYAIALASYLPGLGINHYTIKVVAVLESLLTIPVLFWMGYELLDVKNRRVRLLTALLLAAFVAVSYWHVAITRLALRIVLTPLITALLLIYLARGIRRNTRADFIKAGLILGFGLYTYQAVRMLPVVIVVAVLVAIVFRARTWRERGHYVLNLSSLVLISFVIFLPMFHYSVENPDLFWRRATGRLMGDEVIQQTLDDGTVVMRDASLQERLAAFQSNVPTIMDNIRNVLLMFNWKGDVATINGVPNAPTMSLVSGALLIVGCAAWLSLMVRRPDTIHWLLPMIIFIMLLPSALSIAFPVENPSHTRTSGAIPLVYLLVAFPVALLADALLRVAPAWRGKLAAGLLCGMVLLGSYNANTYLYFEVYPRAYAETFDPYTEPGSVLRSFAESNQGSYGNAFMIGYPHWWSHRAIGLAGGLETKWLNGIVGRERVPSFLQQSATRDEFRYNPALDTLFFYSPDDDETDTYLRELFPQASVIEYVTYTRGDNFMLMRVPALGVEGFHQFLDEHVRSSS